MVVRMGCWRELKLQKLRQEWQPMHVLFILYALLYRCATVASTPNWIANPNLNSGQAVAVNQNITATWVPPTTTVTRLQLYNQTGFTSTPRVLLSMIGYGQLQPTNYSQRIGFSLTIVGVNRTGFNYSVTGYDATTFLLRYNYLAIQGELTTFYSEMRQVAFAAGSNLGNSSAVQRYETQYFPLPGGMVSADFITKQLVVIAFPLGFCLQALSTVSLFSLNASASNNSHYSLNISTTGSNILHNIQYCLIAFERQPLQLNYTVYIDLIVAQIVANTSTNFGDNVTDSMYVYRNGMSGGVHARFQLNLSQVDPYYYYYQYSSGSGSLLVFRGFNHRVRQCGNSSHYYSHQDTLCYDQCPPFTAVDAPRRLCLPCHYSCLNCTIEADPSACTACSSPHNRQLTNSTCPCQPSYYDDSGCLPCASSCLTCSTPSNSSCLTCNSSLFLELEGSGGCGCKSGYYQDGAGSCLACNGAGCLQCEWEGSQQCSSCNSSADFILSNGSCGCSNTTVLINSTCFSNTSSSSNTSSPPTGGCGDGTISSGQQCDDSNTAINDGCSDSCLIQADHSCISNSSLSNSSLCYYSSQIALTSKLIKKIVGKNQVELQLAVSAPNCNQLSLKNYLQSTSNLQLHDLARLLSTGSIGSVKAGWVSIPTKDVFYDAGLRVLFITFSYDASIDLSKKYIEFGGSASVDNAYVRYFYALPSTALTLSSPYNHLATIYYSDSQLHQILSCSKAYLALVMLYWALMLLALVFKKGAVGVEGMLVLQLAYLVMLDEPQLLECVAGLQLAGKYTLGFNVKVVQEEAVQSLLALGMEAQVVNGFSVIAGVFLAVTVGILGMVAYGRFMGNSNGEQEKVARSQQSGSGRQEGSGKAAEQLPLRLSTKMLSYLLQIALSLAFLILPVLLVNVIFTTDDSLVSNLAITLVYFSAIAALWAILVLKRTSWAFATTSFLSLHYHNPSQATCLLRVLNYNFYLLLFLLLLPTALTIALVRDTGIAVLAILVATSLIVLILFVKDKTIIYKHPYHQRRAIVNCAILCLLIVMAVVAHFMYSELGVGLAVAVVKLVLLFVGLVVNAMVLLAVEYKEWQMRSRVRAGKTQETEIKEIMGEIGIANLAFLGDIAYRSNSQEERSARLALPGQAPYSSHGSERDHQKIDKKMNELRSFKKNMQGRVMVNELINFQCEEAEWSSNSVGRKGNAGGLGRQDLTKLQLAEKREEGRKASEQHSDELIIEAGGQQPSQQVVNRVVVQCVRENVSMVVQQQQISVLLPHDLDL